jgi:hypothetical protein
MVDKTKYIERLKSLYREKTNTVLSDDEAVEHFERLVCLVASITEHVRPDEVILSGYGK